MGNGSRSHHLLKHALPEVDVREHFGSIEPKEITREINRLGQRELQAKFRAVYGTQTFSNNNNWLRRKLLEAAGLQTPKAASRGRPSARQPRANSPSSATGLDSASLSRSGSLVSQTVVDRPPSPVSVIRRTKRARKPRCFDDMLMLTQASSGMQSEDEEQQAPRYPMTAASLTLHDRASSTNGAPLSTTDLVWGPSGSQGYSAGQILVSPDAPSSCAWVAAAAPATPDIGGGIRRSPVVPLGCSATAVQLLGATAKALDGDPDAEMALPEWARLPSNECASPTSSCRSAATDVLVASDLRRSSSGAFAPGTPPRPVPTVSPLAGAAAPFATAAVLAAAGRAFPAPEAAQLLPFNGPADFDYFALAPPSAPPALLPMAEYTEQAKEFGIASSDVSDMSTLDIMLQELSSHQELASDLRSLAPLEGMWDCVEGV